MGRVLIACLWGLALLVSVQRSSLAEEFPARPIKIVVGFSPGSGTDIVARVLGAQLSEQMGQPVIIDNREGASGMIGANAVARSNPDGYTLLMAPAILAISQAIRSAPPYNLEKDFVPIALVAQTPFVLITRESFPAKSVAELVSLAKTKTENDRFMFGSGGVGSLAHMSVELLKSEAGIELLHVPYKGDAPVVTDLLAGRIDMMFAGVSLALPLIAQGNVRALAVGTPHRLRFLPDVETMKEAGYGAIEVVSWFGIMGPSGLPPAIVARLNAELTKAVSSPATMKRFSDIGIEPKSSSPQEFKDTISVAIKRWTETANRIGLKID